MSEATKKFIATGEHTDSRIRTAKMKKVAVASMGGFGLGGSGTMMGVGTNFYSPQLSTDFLELPQSKRERIERERFWYRTHPYIGAAVDRHTELPMSKIRFAKPKVPDGAVEEKTKGDYKELIARSHRFFKKMADRIDLLGTLIDISFEYNLHDECWVFAEEPESSVIDSEFDYEDIPSLDGTGGATVQRRLTEKGQKDKTEAEKKKYKGWERIIVLPPELIEENSFPFSSKRRVVLHPDEETKELIQQVQQNPFDELLKQQLEDIPDDVLECVATGRPIPLGTDPFKGSFVFQIYRRKHAYRNEVIPRMDRLQRTLTYMDKLRQSQTSIASRAMTPKRLVWAEDLDEQDVFALREQVDLALLDPDFSIVTNYQVNWEELGARDRLLDLDREYETGHREIFAGMGTTESMLTGEGTYGGDRINLEVINTSYMLFRERIQRYVEKNLFAPVAVRKGFVIMDEDGDEIPIYPNLSFTRLAIRDNQETFDAFLNLYQKGSLPVRFILELLNIDADAALEELEKDAITLNDSTFNEITRSAYSEVGRALAEKSDMLERAAKALNLTVTEEPEEGRFGNKFGSTQRFSSNLAGEQLVTHLLIETKNALRVIAEVLVRVAPEVAVPAPVAQKEAPSAA